MHIYPIAIQYCHQLLILESVKDLIRYLRRDRNESMLARRYLGAANIVARDLIPLLVEFGPKDNDLFDVVLRYLFDH